MIEKWEPAILAGFSDVPVDKMENIDDEFQKAIEDILQDGPKHFDIERIRTIIDQMLLERQVDIESGPHEVIPDVVVTDILYSTNKRGLVEFLKSGGIENAHYMRNQPAEYWLKLLQETMCRCNNKPRVLLLSYPNANYNKELEANETARIETQKNEMGEESLNKAQMIVKNAKENTHLAPDELLMKMPFADTTSMAYRNLTYYNYTTSKQPESFDLKSIPFRFHFDDIKSEFVRIFMFLDTSEIAVGDQMYLSLLSNLWLECPLRTSDGREISLEEVTKQRERDAITFYNYIGTSQSHLVRFVARLKMEKYEDVVKLFQDVLFDAEFTNERAKSIIAQILNGIPSSKQDSQTVLSEVDDNIYFNNQTYLHAASFLRQKNFLEEVKAELYTKPDALGEKLQELRKRIVQSKNTFVYMATNLEKLEKAHGNQASRVWKLFFKHENEDEILPEGTLSQRYPITAEWKYRDSRPKLRHAIVGLPGTESCFMKQSMDFNITDWESKEVATVRLMLAYLSNIMFDQIRGQGWTYGVGISATVNKGRLDMNFYRASDLILAYKEFRKIVENYSSDTTRDDANKWSAVKLDSARGSLIYSWVEEDETPASLARSSVSSYLRKANDPFYSRRFVTMLSQVTLDEVKSVAKKYLPTFFYPKQTYTTIVCSPKEVENVREMFNLYQFDLEEIGDLDNSILTE